MQSVTRAVAAVALAIAAITPSASAQSLVDPTLHAERVATNLGLGQIDLTSGFAFMSDGVILAVRRPTGEIYRLDLKPDTVVLPGPVVRDLDIIAPDPQDYQSEYGVQSITHLAGPDSIDYVYVRYDHALLPGADTPQQDLDPDGASLPNENVIERYIWDPKGNAGDGALIFDRLIYTTTLNTRYHHGGPVIFGPDGMLYTMYGDLRLGGGNLAGNVPGGIVNVEGTIIRLTPDGLVPDDNPFLLHDVPPPVDPTQAVPIDIPPPDSFAPPGTEPWFAYGFRNSFGLTFDPVTSALWMTDNGEDTFDEINLIVPGFNGGWAAFAGPVGHSPNTGDLNSLVLLLNATYSDPKFSWVDTLGLTAIHFLQGSALGPRYDDLVIVGAFNNGYLWGLRLNASRNGFTFNSPDLKDLVDDAPDTQASPIGTEGEELLFGSDFGADFSGTIAIERGPDNLPYVLTAQGDLIRIVRDFPPCPADINHDLFVDAVDLAELLGNWESPKFQPSADVNHDGAVNSDDLSVLIANWGPCP